VTGKALGVNLFGRVLRRIEYLARVAAALHMRRPGTMAALATLVRGLLIECGLPMRGLLPVVVDLLMTGLAGFRSYVLRDAGGWGSGLSRSGLSFPIGGWLASLV
jgi:hypothetical protein